LRWPRKDPTIALYLVIQIGAFLSRYIPRSWRYLIGTAVGDLVFLTWPSKRRILLENTVAVLGSDVRDPSVRRLAKKSMRNYCKYLIEFLDLPNMSSSDEVVASMKIHGLEHLRAAVERGKGVIIASAHFGTIEVGALRLQDFVGVHAVYDTFKPEYLDRLIQRKRLEKGIHLIGVNDVRSMMRALRHGDALTLLFDRPLDRAKGVTVRYFGRETAVPGGPAVLAMKTGAALLPVFMYRQPDKSFECRLFPPVAWVETGDRESDVRGIMQKLMDVLQIVVRERPDQWYMFRPMWPEWHAREETGSREVAPGEPGR
jgi:lauroyl/myristoyl acyltransferase